MSKRKKKFLILFERSNSEVVQLLYTHASIFEKELPLSRGCLFLNLALLVPRNKKSGRHKLSIVKAKVKIAAVLVQCERVAFFFPSGTLVCAIKLH